jgi:DNA polymerase-1
LLVQKRLGMLAEGKNAWLNSVTKKGRIHSSIHTAGTISGRCSSSNPNLQQIPAVRSEYGKECRELFKAPEGKVLTGCDASGLELRALASFLYQFDSGKFTREILEGDIHQLNSDILGIDRDNSKTFIYSLIYGASNQRLGEAVGKGMKEGKRLRDTFMAKMPAFKKLLSAIERAVAVKGHLVGVDGRVIEVRSKHSLLNFLLQSCGAVIMKQALVEFAKLAKHPYEMHANVHDEVQFSCLEEHSDELGETFVAAIVKAGEVLDIKCPLDGDYKVGNNWAETH